MNRKNLVVWIVVTISISTLIVFMLMKDVVPNFSVTAEDTTKPIPQHYVAFIDPSLCSSKKDVSNSTAILVKCMLTSSNVTGVGNLSPAIFMAKNIS